MARPRKKIQDQVAAEVVEFNYDDSDALYSQVMTTGASSATAPAWHVPVSAVTVQEVHTSPAPSAPIMQPSTIFLVEGKVRLDQATGPVFSDQRRIVSATDIDAAIQKFMNYFSNMSNPTQRYTVVTASASETIL